MRTSYAEKQAFQLLEEMFANIPDVLGRVRRNTVGTEHSAGTS
jgi:hypothetical protein